MLIELYKNHQHCTLSVQYDLFGRVTVFQIATRKLKNKTSTWQRKVCFDEEKEANLYLCDLEFKYRSRGYIYAS